MGLLFGILAYTVGFYTWLLLARFFLDLIVGVNPRFNPKGLLLVVCELIYTFTDPPLKFIRRFIKPVRLGTVSLDFGWTILFIVFSYLQGLLATLASR